MKRYLPASLVCAAFVAAVLLVAFNPHHPEQVTVIEEKKPAELWDVYQFGEHGLYMTYPAGQQPFPGQTLVAKNVRHDELKQYQTGAPKLSN